MNEWQPLRGLQGTIRQQLEQQFQDRNQTATLRDDVASANARNQPDIREAICNATWLVAQTDPQFAIDFERHE